MKSSIAHERALQGGYEKLEHGMAQIACGSLRETGGSALMGLGSATEMASGSACVSVVRDYN